MRYLRIEFEALPPERPLTFPGDKIEWVGPNDPSRIADRGDLWVSTT